MKNMTKQKLIDRMKEIDNARDKAWTEYLCGHISLAECQQIACNEEYTAIVKQLNQRGC